MSPAKKIDMGMDFSDFDKKFFKFTMKTMPDAFFDAIIETLPYILKDAIEEKPYAPHKSGHLWRSQKVELPKKIGKAFEAVFGFNTPYAARLHEAPDNWSWTLKGSGPKYLEVKLIKNKNKYMLMITKRARAKARI